MSDRPLRVVQFGLGPIGAACAAAVLERRPSLELVGAIDVDPAKAGADVGELLGGASLGVKVSDDAERTLARARPDAVLHATSSFLDRVAGQLELCARHGAHVVSSTEELLFPWERHPVLAERLDALAREHGATLLGTGVNPGFVMDTLALAASGVCRELRRVEARRVVDAGLRRLPLQRKVGAGLSAAEFAARKQAGTLGHVGLVESLQLVAHGLRWPLERVDEELQPVPAAADRVTEHLALKAGDVAGIHHTARGFVGGVERISLDLRMYVGADDPLDRVLLDGDPPVDLRVHGGIFGDSATVAVLVNALPRVLEARRGLITMLDLPLLRAAAVLPRSGGA
jgi:4-hydroxy-tetrahydrodipicolinate reductase